MTACKKHSESPVKGYNQCAGCEIEALRAENGRLTREAKNDAIAYKAVIERQEQLREERDSFQREGIRAMEQLEAARGLLERVQLASSVYRSTLRSVRKDIRDDIARGGMAESWNDAAETIAVVLEQGEAATPAPEVRQPLSGDISDQDWINAGCPPEVRQSAKQAQSVPGVSGIGRDADHPRALVLYLRAEPTDDDIRAVQEALRAGAAERGERQEAVPEIVCRRLLFAFGLECNSIGLLGAAENLHKGMKEAAAAHRQAQQGGSHEVS